MRLNVFFPWYIESFWQGLAQWHSFELEQNSVSNNPQDVLDNWKQVTKSSIQRLLLDRSFWQGSEYASGIEWANLINSLNAKAVII